MGQHFVIINIEKNCRLHIGKFAETYLESPLGHCLDPDDWGEDRIILLGSDAKDLPAGIKKSEETKRAFRYDGPDGDHDYSRRGYRSYSDTSVLRNICSREYIKAELFPRRSSNPGLGEVLLPKILWTSPSSFNFSAEISTRGVWAGARVDIVEFDVVKDDPNWKDITELEFFNYYSLWHIDVHTYGMPHICEGKLCMKYKEEADAFYRKQDSEKALENSRPIVVYKSPVLSLNQAPTSHPPNSRDASSIEKLPNELHEEIFDWLSENDLVACTLVSKTLSLEATRILYFSVTLETSEQTGLLLETVTRRAELATYIRRLRVVTMANWESLQVAHDILKQLPLLESLTFAPCWFSYGDLPCHEYPFTLRRLTWGLRDDDAFKRFCRYHPGALIKIREPMTTMWTYREDADVY